MNRQQADTVVGLLVVAVLVVGGGPSWQAYQQQRAMDRMMGSMMGTSMGGVHGTNPLWYVLGTVLVAAVVGGFYLVVRDDLSTTDVTAQPAPETIGESVAEPVEDEPPSDAIDPEEQPPCSRTRPPAGRRTTGPRASSQFAGHHAD